MMRMMTTMIGSMPLCHSVGTHDAVNDADDVDDDDGDDDGEADDAHAGAADADNAHDHNVLDPLGFCPQLESHPQGAQMQL